MTRSRITKHDGPAGEQQPRRFAYAVGEEVVAHVRQEDAFGLDEDPLAAHAPMLAWTIGQITARIERAEGAAYLLHFRHDHARYLTVVPEIAIEGTA